MELATVRLKAIVVCSLVGSGAIRGSQRKEYGRGRRAGRRRTWRRQIAPSRQAIAGRQFQTIRARRSWSRVTPAGELVLKCGESCCGPTFDVSLPQCTRTDFDAPQLV